MSGQAFQSVKAVTIDAEGTLLHPYPSVGAVYAEVLGGHGIILEPSDLDKSFRRAFRAASSEPRDEVSDRSEREFWRRVVRQTLEDCDSKNRFEAIFEDLYDAFGSAHRWELVDDAFTTIRGLRDHGYRVGILSNWDSRLRRVLGELGLDSLLDGCFISCEIGFEKPDPRIFYYVENFFELASHEILHIGNTLIHDAEGAKDAGWCYLVLRNSETASLDDQYLISNLSEVIDILPKHR